MPGYVFGVDPSTSARHRLLARYRRAGRHRRPDRYPPAPAPGRHPHRPIAVLAILLVATAVSGWFAAPGAAALATLIAP